MKAYEFKAALNPDGSLPVLPSVAEQLGKEQAVRMLIPEEDEEREWAQ